MRTLSFLIFLFLLTITVPISCAENLDTEYNYDYLDNIDTLYEEVESENSIDDHIVPRLKCESSQMLKCDTLSGCQTQDLKQCSCVDKCQSCELRNQTNLVVVKDKSGADLTCQYCTSKICTLLCINCNSPDKISLPLQPNECCQRCCDKQFGYRRTTCDHLECCPVTAVKCTLGMKPVLIKPVNDSQCPHWECIHDCPVIPPGVPTYVDANGCKQQCPISQCLKCKNSDDITIQGFSPNGCPSCPQCCNKDFGAFHNVTSGHDQCCPIISVLCIGGYVPKVVKSTDPTKCPQMTCVCPDGTDEHTSTDSGDITRHYCAPKCNHDQHLECDFSNPLYPDCKCNPCVNCKAVKCKQPICAKSETLRKADCCSCCGGCCPNKVFTDALTGCKHCCPQVSCLINPVCNDNQVSTLFRDLRGCPTCNHCCPKIECNQKFGSFFNMTTQCVECCPILKNTCPSNKKPRLLKSTDETKCSTIVCV
jgi:hypothetical protein